MSFSGLINHFINLFKKFSTIQKILLLLFLFFHLTLLFSVSNRGLYGNKIFSLWRGFAWDTSGWIARGGDFFAIYEAGHQAILGRPVFQVQPELNLISKDESKMRAPYVATFRYPPIVAYSVSIFLNIFPPDLSYKFWVLLNEFLIFLGIYFSSKRARNPDIAFATISAWLLFYPLHIEYYLGQFSLLMGFLLFFCALNLLERNDNKAIFWWGLSIFLKFYSILFALYWFFRRKFKLPAFWIIAVFLTSIIYFFIFPADLKIFYDKGIAGRLFSKTREASIDDKAKENVSETATLKNIPPNLYWGSHGVQRAAIALARIFYLKMDSNKHFLVPYWAHYILYLVMLFPIPFLIISAYNTRKNPLSIITLFSLGWFFWYFDTWEHHYTLILPLLTLLIAEEILTGFRGILVYILLASPSLWFVFRNCDINPLFPQNPISYFILETLYYLIKPIGVIYLFLFLFFHKTSKVTQNKV